MGKRKKFSRAISGALACIMLVTTMVCSSAPIASAASVDPQVQLYYAQKNLIYGKNNIQYEGRVAVKKTDGPKKVVVHYTLDGVNWQDLSSRFEKIDPNDQQYEVWEFNLLASTVPLTFAIRYDVNGQTYWDNNDGNNYCLSSNVPVVLGKSALRVVYTNGFNPDELLYLKNLGYEKNVTIYYTTDNWCTTKCAQSQYVQAVGNNVEEWTIPFSISHGGSNVQYCVSYTVNGTTYIDNNFGVNYSR